MRTWKDVATLVKTRNLNGRFVVRPAADFPFIFELGCEIAFVPPQTDLPRSGHVDYVRDIDGATFEVGFDTVVDESVAKGLVGCHCLMRRADIDESLYEEEPATWVGWTVVESNGNPVGDVVSLVENPGQDLLEVRREDGRLSYIPAVDAFICEVDVESCEIVVDVPDGLLDL